MLNPARACCCRSSPCADACHIVASPNSTKCSTCEGGNAAVVAGFSHTWDPQQYFAPNTRSSCFTATTIPTARDCAFNVVGTNYPWLNEDFSGTQYRTSRTRAELYFYCVPWDTPRFNPSIGLAFSEATYQYPTITVSNPTVTFERFYQTSPSATCAYRVKTLAGGNANAGEFVAEYLHCTTEANWPLPMREWVNDPVCKYSIVKLARTVYYQRATDPTYRGCPPAGWACPAAPSTFTRTVLGSTEGWYYLKAPPAGTYEQNQYCFNRGTYQLGYSEFAYDQAGGSTPIDSFPPQFDPLDPRSFTAVDPNPGVIAGHPGQVDRFDIVWPLTLVLQ